jgi:hypothetical protein
MEVKGKILAKKGDNKAFKLDDGNWYNLNDNVIPYLEKMNKGDEVVVTFEKKGVSRYVSKLVNTAEVAKTETTSTTEFACEVCNAPLKDGKFKKCYMCNKSGATKKEDPKSNPAVTEPKKPYTPYDNPEKTAQIQRGNALNAAAAVVGGCNLNNPKTSEEIEAIKQFTLLLAEDFLTWLRGE